MPNICKHILQGSIDWVSLFQTGFKYFIVIFESKLYSNFNSTFRWLNRNWDTTENIWKIIIDKHDENFQICYYTLVEIFQTAWCGKTSDNIFYASMKKFIELFKPNIVTPITKLQKKQ